MLLGPQGKHLTHEVTTTLMTEVSGVVNSRPIPNISGDPDALCCRQTCFFNNEQM